MAGINNAMDFNYMTGTCRDQLKAQAQGVQRQGLQERASAEYADLPEEDFLNRLTEKSRETGSAPGIGYIPGADSTLTAGELSAAERAAMSMTEYKLYLYDRISSLPVHPWNMQVFAAVNISEAGFAAMKNDPEYEKWVLDCLRTNFQAYDPWGAGSGKRYVVFYFGATKEECRVESWRSGWRDEERERLYRKKAKDSIWERRRKKRKALLAMYEELAEKKALSKRMAVSAYYAELAAQPPEAEKIPPTECEALAMQIFSRFRANIKLNMFRIKKL